MLFGVRKLACAFAEEACFLMLKLLCGTTLQPFEPGSALPPKKQQQAAALHIGQSPRLLSALS